MAAGEDPRHGFADSGEYLRAVMRASTGQVDERLRLLDAGPTGPIGWCLHPTATLWHFFDWGHALCGPLVFDAACVAAPDPTRACALCVEMRVALGPGFLHTHKFLDVTPPGVQSPRRVLCRCGASEERTWG